MTVKAGFTDKEMERYRRQIPVFGPDGQARLKASAVFVAGAGGLGSAILTYLAAAGVGTLRILDQDVVRLDNLNRQTLYTESDVGKSKAVCAGLKLRGMNPFVRVEALQARMEPGNIRDRLIGCSVAVDALDNFETRFVLNRAAVELGIPLVHGAVHEFSGQVMTVLPGRTACLKCVFPDVPTRPGFPVVGTAPGIIGAVQAGEVVKILAGIETLAAGRLLFWDGRRSSWDEVEVRKNPACSDCGGRRGKP